MSGIGPVGPGGDRTANGELEDGPVPIAAGKPPPPLGMPKLAACQSFCRSERGTAIFTVPTPWSW